MKKLVFITLALFAIILFTTFASASYKLLCINDGQSVLFSKCNSNIADRTCTSSSGCQYCVDEIRRGEYCPASLNICNTEGFSCSSLDTEGTPITPVNETQDEVDYLNIQSISTNPDLPISFVGIKTFEVTFQSNTYPVSVSFLLYDAFGNLISTSYSTSVSNLANSDLSYTTPTLNPSVYTLKAKFVDNTQSNQIKNLGQFTVTSSSGNQNNNNSTQPQQNNTQGSQNNSNTNPSPTPNTQNNQTQQNDSDEGFSFSNFFKKTPDKIKEEPVVQQETQTPENSILLTNNSKFQSKITGAVIGTVTGVGFSVLLMVALLILLFYLWKIGKQDDFKKQDFVEVTNKKKKSTP